MFETYELRILPVHRYIAATRKQQHALLPATPGIYVWTRSIAQGLPGGDVDNTQFHDRLRERVKPIIKPDLAQAGHYRSVSVQDSPAELRPNTYQRIERLRSAGYPIEIEWAFLCASMFQRPLYVGKALNLKARLRAHLSGQSRHVREMEEYGIRLEDCFIILAELKVPPEDFPYGPDDDEDGVSDSDTASYLDDDDYDELPAGSSLDSKMVNDLVCLAESLVIRLAHPIFNAKMD
jgi:hypothetical protein